MPPSQSLSGVNGTALPAYSDEFVQDFHLFPFSPDMQKHIRHLQDYNSTAIGKKQLDFLALLYYCLLPSQQHLQWHNLYSVVSVYGLSKVSLSRALSTAVNV